MTREEYVHFLRTKKYVCKHKTSMNIPSSTDPSFAMSGAEIFSRTMKGLSVASPIGLEFNEVPIGKVTDLETPIKQRFDVLNRAKSELEMSDKMAEGAYEKMLKEIEEQKNKNQKEIIDNNN